MSLRAGLGGASHNACGSLHERAGNAGLAVGTALHAVEPLRESVTPFLGPSYSPEEVKATLDNCKLNYQWASETDAVSFAVDALLKGRLLGWFNGAMEIGPRALGARS
jgi:carbamoyltransferase